MFGDKSKGWRRSVFYKVCIPVRLIVLPAIIYTLLEYWDFGFIMVAVLGFGAFITNMIRICRKDPAWFEFNRWFHALIGFTIGLIALFDEMWGSVLITCLLVLDPLIGVVLSLQEADWNKKIKYSTLSVIAE